MSNPDENQLDEATSEANALKERPNKTALKKETQALTDLAISFANLSASAKNELSLPDELTKAINEYSKTKSFIAKKRQGQYLGKIFRKQHDKIIDEIREAVKKATDVSNEQNALFHQIEAWREKLLSGDNQALTDFIKAYPSVDRQALRHLIQKAKKEKTAEKNLGHAKALFRHLREIINA